MLKMWVVAGTILVLALTINARSHTPADAPSPPDVPNPPDAPSPPDAPNPPEAEEATPKEVMEVFCERECALGVARPGCRCHEEPPARPRLCTLACQLAEAGEDCRCTIATNNSSLGANETRMTITQTTVLAISRAEPRRASTPAADLTTTALQGSNNKDEDFDVDQFCKQACPAGEGGALCNCADHPFG